MKRMHDEKPILISKTNIESDLSTALADKVLGLEIEKDKNFVEIYDTPYFSIFRISINLNGSYRDTLLASATIYLGNSIDEVEYVKNLNLKYANYSLSKEVNQEIYPDCVIIDSNQKTMRLSFNKQGKCFGGGHIDNFIVVPKGILK